MAPPYSRRKIPLPGLNRRPAVVASLNDARHLLSDARAAVRQGASALEIRADFFPREVLRPAELRDLLAKVRKTARRPLILTLRSRAEGGHLPRRFRERDRLHLIRACLSEASLIDVELSANEVNRHVVMEAHKRGRSVILSYHNFRETPADPVLRRLAGKAFRMHGDILKVAVKPRRSADVTRLMEFCRGAPFRYRVFLAIGRLGSWTRLDGVRWGSCLLYAYVRKAVAPGQFSVKEVMERLRSFRR